MPSVQYVGRVTSFQGKRLFDILSRLKNFGVGRLVYRHVMNKRYEEPSFYIITKVAPDMSDPTESVQDYYADKLTRGIATGIKVFRGEQKGIANIRTGFKADWRLVPKEDEHLFLDKIGQARPHNIVDDKTQMPPLFKKLFVEEKKRHGVEVSEELMLKLMIRSGPDNRALLKSEADLLQVTSETQS